MCVFHAIWISSNTFFMHPNNTATISAHDKWQTLVRHFSMPYYKFRRPRLSFLAYAITFARETVPSESVSLRASDFKSNWINSFRNSPAESTHGRLASYLSSINCIESVDGIVTQAMARCGHSHYCTRCDTLVNLKHPTLERKRRRGL